jgi:hypothetical protein
MTIEGTIKISQPDIYILEGMDSLQTRAIVLKTDVGIDVITTTVIMYLLHNRLIKKVSSEQYKSNLQQWKYSNVYLCTRYLIMLFALTVN